MTVSDVDENLSFGSDQYPITGPEDVDKLRVIKLNRSSTDENDHGEPIEHQSEEQRKALERLNHDHKIIKEYKTVESGSTLDRETINGALRHIRDGEANILSAMKVDRITRAHPLESNLLWKKLAEAGGLVFTSTLGLVNWDDPLDIQQLVHQTNFAWQWYQRIQNGTAGAYKEALEQGKYIQKTPWGFEKDSDQRISVNARARPYIRKMFELMLEEKNRAEVYRRINDELSANNDLDLLRDGKTELSYSQVKSVLTSELCLGNLTYDGTVVNTKSELQIVDYETFDKVQKIIDNRKPTQSQTPDLPEAIGRAGDRYGVEYVLSLLDSFTPHCRKCGGDLEPNGSTRRKNIPLQNYECVECNHQGPLLTEAEIDKLHQTHPLRCPFCTNTGSFEHESVGDRHYLYKCKICLKEFRCELPPDKIKRAVENTDTMFDIEKPYKPTPEEGDEDDGRKNAELTRFIRSAG